VVFDENGVLGQRESDGTFGGGDSTSYMGQYIYLCPDAIDFNYARFFSVGFGAYVRHPQNNYSSYYKHPWDGRISRDQLKGILLALIKQKNTKEILKVFIHHAAWLWMFAYNARGNGSLTKWKLPDLTGPDVWAMYIRGVFGKAAILFYPILCILDLHNLINALAVKRNNNGHVISFLACLFVSVDIAPTFVSKYTLKINSYKFLIANLITFWCGFRGSCFMVEHYKRKLNEYAQ